MVPGSTLRRPLLRLERHTRSVLPPLGRVDGTFRPVPPLLSVAVGENLRHLLGLLDDEAPDIGEEATLEPLGLSSTCCLRHELVTLRSARRAIQSPAGFLRMCVRYCALAMLIDP